jgi:hypothetical protein
MIPISTIIAQERLIAMATARCSGRYPAWWPRAARRVRREHGLRAVREIRRLVPKWRESRQERLWQTPRRQGPLWTLKDGGPFGWA